MMPLGIVASAYKPGLSDVIMSLSPVGYWRLDETSGTQATDSSGHGRHGTYTGVHTLAAQDGYATFDGGYVSIPTDPAFSIGASGMSMFVLTRPTVISAARQMIVSKGSSNRYEWSYEVSGSTRRARASITAASGGSIILDDSVAAAYDVGEWAATVVTFPVPVAGNPVPMYVNSATPLASTNTGNASNTYWASTAPVQIAARAGTLVIRAAIAHVALFSGQLATEQIETLMTAAEGLIP